MNQLLTESDEQERGYQDLMAKAQLADRKADGEWDNDPTLSDPTHLKAVEAFSALKTLGRYTFFITLILIFHMFLGFMSVYVVVFDIIGDSFYHLEDVLIIM